MIKKIKLTQGKFAIVDEDDYERINKYKWGYLKTKDGNIYAQRGHRLNDNRTLYMHRFIMGEPKGKYVDHINRNGLDNRKVNLRISNNHLNQYNRKLNKNNTSGYNGVYWSKKTKRWISQMMIYWKMIRIGSFDSKEDAYKARLLFQRAYLKNP